MCRIHGAFCTSDRREYRNSLLSRYRFTDMVSSGSIGDEAEADDADPGSGSRDDDDDVVDSLVLKSALRIDDDDEDNVVMLLSSIL